MKKIKDGSEILFDLFIRGNPEAEARLNDERRKIRLISQLRDLREKAGMSHSELALKTGTTPEAIAQLEDLDSETHSLEDLQRIVSELGMELEVKIIKKSSKKHGRAAVVVPA